MNTLYDQCPVVWDKLHSAGYPSLARMSLYFSRPSEMDAALGYVKATSPWMNGVNKPSRSSERRARTWLDSRDGHYSQRAFDTTPMPEVKLEVKPAGKLLLVAATPEIAAKIEKLCAILGAEVTEV